MQTPRIASRKHTLTSGGDTLDSRPGGDYDTNYDRNHLQTDNSLPQITSVPHLPNFSHLEAYDFES